MFSRANRYPKPKNHEHAGEQYADAVWKLGIVAIEFMGEGVPLSWVRSVDCASRSAGKLRAFSAGPKLFHLPGTMMKTTGRPFWRA